MRGRFVAIILVVCSVYTFAQSKKDTANNAYWVDMMQDQSVRFSATQKAFETYWDGRTRTKGDGYNPFKRWEWFMRYELKDNGSYRSGSDIQTAVRSFQKQYPSTYNHGLRSGGKVWTPLGPINKPVASSGQPNGMGRINAVGIHPTNKNTIFVGSPNGGIWRSYDHGLSWTSNTDTNFIMQISSIVFNPKNPSIVYAGTGDRDAGARSPRGVMKSIDGGITWSSVNNGMGDQVVGKMIIDPNHPDTLVAATHGGIYRTTNGGQTWTRRNGAAVTFKDIVYVPGNFKKQFAAFGGSLVASTDGGITWNSVSIPVSGNRIAIAVTPDDPAYVYVVQTTRTSFAGLMQSTDTGKTFTTMSTTPNIMDWSTNGSGSGGQAWYDLDIAADPKNKNTIFVGGINIWKSTDGGKSWNISAHWTGSGGNPAVHADHHVFEWSVDGTTLYNGNDGGIYYTSDLGLNWTDRSSGLPISEIYKIGQHPYMENRVICGYQDNGSAIYRGAGDWTTEIGGDGMECIFDYQDDNFVYGALYYGQIRRSTNGGRNFSRITNGISESGAWVTPYILNETDPNTMYVGMRQDIWRSSNVRSGASWSNISSAITAGSGSWAVLESSPANSNILYACKTSRTMFRCDNALSSNPTWTNISTNLPSGSAPSDIEAHPFDENIVYITAGSKVHVSLDKGVNWTDISGNLPNTSKRAIAYDRFSDGGLYVGGTPKVYYIDSTLTNWIEYSDGFPGDVSVTELEIFYDTLNPKQSRLRAATYGRGLWSVALYNEDFYLPVAEIRGDSGYFCNADTLYLYGDSAKNADSYTWTIRPNSGFSFVNSTNSKSKNIALVFLQDGFYTIDQYVKNNMGRDTATWMNGIHIGTDPGISCVTTTAATSPTTHGITKVELANLTSNSGTFNGTQSNTAFTCNDAAFLYADSAYTIKVTTPSANFVRVYVDYNADGDFTDSGELVASGNMQSGAHNLSFTTPASGISFNSALRMRVIADNASISSPCAALSLGESEDYTVWVDQLAAGIAVSDTITCPNQIVSISANPEGKIDSVYWDFGSNATPQTVHGVGPHAVRYNGTGIWKFRVRLNADHWTEDSIMVREAPIANLVVDSANSKLCNYGHALMLVQGVKDTNATFKWYLNNNLLSAVTDSFYTHNNLISTGSFTYVVITSNGICTDTSQSVQLSTFPQPTAWADVDDNKQCLTGNLFRFSDKSFVQGGGNLSRNWDFGDSTSSTSRNVNHSYTKTGMYTVMLESITSQGCVAQTATVVSVIDDPDSTFIVQDLGQNRFKFWPNDTTHINYWWSFGDGMNVSTDLRPTHTYLSAGTYQVRLQIESVDACFATKYEAVEIEQSISVEAFNSLFGIDVYPNPSNGVVYVDLTDSREVQIQVVELSGKVIANHKIDGNVDRYPIYLPESGLYLIRATINGVSTTYKVSNL